MSLYPRASGSVAEGRRYWPHRSRELAKTVEALEIASQHKNQFVADISHELRTSLAAILGYAELIQEGFYEPQGPKSLDALTRIRSNGKPFAAAVRISGLCHNRSRSITDYQLACAFLELNRFSGGTGKIAGFPDRKRRANR